MPQSLPDSPVDIAIIGAGPAGLAAANRCLLGGCSVVVLEEAKPIEERQHSNPDDVAGGVGGAGLYSDGKLSFYPSGHALWALPAVRVLREAYGWLEGLCKDLVGRFPPFPDEVTLDKWEGGKTDAPFERKKYTSLVLSPEQSSLLVTRLLAPVGHHVFAHHRMTRVVYALGMFEISFLDSQARPGVLHARRVILCGGRFGALILPAISPRPDVLFRRFEFGVRIEQPSGEFFLKNDTSVDTKLRHVDASGDLEWRTFCCCRDGIVLPSAVGEVYTCSGSAWTGSCKSNVGFNCRIATARAFRELMPEIEHVLSGNIKPFEVQLRDFQDPSSKQLFFGKELDSRLRRGLAELTKQPGLESAALHGPCIEGTGDYPKLSVRLETSIPGLYVAGDSTGMFRGLVSALISGFYAGSHAAEARLEDPQEISGGVPIKRSPIAAMPLIFTAQSKQVFYCRDVICEYVLKHEKLPINPFRVFDYFLQDRVDRDLIRRGNNHLIRACDELWVFGPISDGVLFELIYAGHLNKPIRFFTLGTFIKDINPVESLDEVRFEPEVHAPQQRRQGLMLELRRLVDRGLVRNTQPTLFDLI